MKIVKEKIEIAELKEMTKMFGNMVKAVVDIEKGIMAVDAELHMDLLQLLMESEHSEPKDCWGINLYPEKTGEDFLEFDSMVNLKPAFDNRSRGIESAQTREKITKIVEKLCNTKV